VYVCVYAYIVYRGDDFFHVCVCVCVRQYHSSVVMCAYVRAASICVCVCELVCTHIFFFLRFFFPSPPVSLIFLFSSSLISSSAIVCEKCVVLFFVFSHIYTCICRCRCCRCRVPLCVCVCVCVSLSVHFLLVNILIVTFISCFPFGSNFRCVQTKRRIYIFEIWTPRFCRGRKTKCMHTA